MVLDHSLASEEDFLADVKKRRVLETTVRMGPHASNIGLPKSAKKIKVYDMYELSTRLLKNGI